MVKIYDIENYRDTAQLEHNKDAHLAQDAEIILFTGVRYERLCDQAATAVNIEQFVEVPRRTSICRTNVGLTLKTV